MQISFLLSRHKSATINRADQKLISIRGGGPLDIKWTKKLDSLSMTSQTLVFLKGGNLKKGSSKISKKETRITS